MADTFGCLDLASAVHRRSWTGGALVGAGEEVYADIGK
jgi:hypothetical protein